MPAVATAKSHIAYHVVAEPATNVVVVEFLARETLDPLQASALSEQLNSLIRPELTRNFVLDFRNVQSLGDAALHRIKDFIRKVGWVWICSMHRTLRHQAAQVGLDDRADFAANRQVAIKAARKNARRDEEDTAEYPVWVD